MSIFTTKAFQQLLHDLHQQAHADFQQRRAARESGQPFDSSTAWLSISPEQGRLLYLLACQNQAKHIVEFGTSYGVSSLYLAAATAENQGKLTTCEFQAEKAEVAAKHFSQAGLSAYIEQRIGDATQTLADYPQPIDLLFLDGDKSLYSPLFKQLQPQLADKAIVIADNTNVSGCQDYVQHLNATQVSIPLFDGRMLLSQYRRAY